MMWTRRATSRARQLRQHALVVQTSSDRRGRLLEGKRQAGLPMPAHTPTAYRANSKFESEPGELRLDDRCFASASWRKEWGGAEGAGGWT